jgi:hypothetical protein
LQRRAIMFANSIWFSCHAPGIKFVPKPLNKPLDEPARRSWQRANDPKNVEFAPGSTHSFLIFLLARNNYERYVAEALQQSRKIQHALLGAVGWS